MVKITLRIAEVIQNRVPAPVQFVIAIALLAVSSYGPLDLEIPAVLSAGMTLAGVGLLGTSLMPIAMVPFDANGWEELSGWGQTIVLFVVTMVILCLFVLLFFLPSQLY